MLNTNHFSFCIHFRFSLYSYLMKSFLFLFRFRFLKLIVLLLVYIKREKIIFVFIFVFVTKKGLKCMLCGFFILPLTFPLHQCKSFMPKPTVVRLPWYNHDCTMVSKPRLYYVNHGSRNMVQPCSRKWHT